MYFFGFLFCNTVLQWNSKGSITNSLYILTLPIWFLFFFSQINFMSFKIAVQSKEFRFSSTEHGYFSTCDDHHAIDGNSFILPVRSWSEKKTWWTRFQVSVHPSFDSYVATIRVRKTYYAVCSIENTPHPTCICI